MYANIGDWLIVNSHAEGRPTRHGEIIGVGPGGRPPYTVHWTDTEHEAVVFPGPDAIVVSADERAAQGRRESERIGRLQSAIRSGPPAG